MHIYKPFYKKLWPLLILLITLGCMQGCKPSGALRQLSLRALPDTSFTVRNNADTLTSIPVWRNYFRDALLIRLIDTALINNPDYQIALRQIDIARAQLQMRRAALLPTVNGIVSGGIDKYGDYTMNGVGNFDTNLSPNIKSDQRIPNPTPDLFVGFRSSWEIDVWGRLKAQRNAVASQLLATEQGVRFTKTQVVAMVAELYYTLQAIDDELQIVDKNLALQKQALDIVKVQKDAGRATELAVQQFAAQIHNTNAIKIQLQQELIAAENLLNQTLGRYPKRIDRTQSFINMPTPLLPVVASLKDMLLQRPDVQQASLQLAAANFDIKAAQAAFYPAISLTPYLAFNAFNLATWFRPGSLAYGGLAGLTAPIFQQRQLKTNLAIQDNVRQQQHWVYQQKLLHSFSEFATQWHNYNHQEQILQQKQQEVAALTAAVTTAKELYAAGFANYLEVITTQKGALEAELQLITAKKNWMLSSVHLYQSLGGGWQ
ncbi:MAG TPA: RND transporter [Chitinophagaceae bacterium]|nr:RND transporter [Chitinophagaceae bacterium]